MFFFLMHLVYERGESTRDAGQGLAQDVLAPGQIAKPKRGEWPGEVTPYGFLDKQEYGSVRDFTDDRPQLFKQDDIL